MACATSLEVDPLPVTADPDEEIESLAEGIADAREDSVQLLSPDWFTRALASADEARALRKQGDSIERILGEVAEGRAELAEARAAARTARPALEAPLTARAKARAAGATSLGDAYTQVERDFVELARSVEGGDLEEAREDAPAIAQRYRDLELKAIQEQTLGSVRTTIEVARAEGATDNVPQALRAARLSLQDAEKFVEEHRYADRPIQRYAEEARFAADRALHLNRATLELEELGSRKAAIAQEEALHRIARALGVPDQRDLAAARQVEVLHGAALAMRNDRDFLVAHNRDLRDELASAVEVAGELDAANRDLERDRRFEALFAKARALFEPGEAEVYRQGILLVIRLHGLDFEVGEAAIGPENYALLAKLQRAIRLFGEPYVTIEGHTDSTGTDAFNQHLSRERADAVKSYLVANNVLAPSYLRALGKGSSEPIESNESVKGRAANRRIDVLMNTKGLLLIAEEKR